MKDLDALIEILKNNPGCMVSVDNDAWYIEKPLPDGWQGMDDDEWRIFSTDSSLADSSQFVIDNDHAYGVLEALASIVGVIVNRV